MINKVNMDGVKGYGEGAASVPKGGYVVRIMGAVAKQNSVGQYLEVSCDIAEGEFKDTFANDYRAQTGETKKWRCTAFVNVPRDDGTEKDLWTKRSFQTFIDALEATNEQYHFDWDETKMKGLLVGAIFAGREWEDRDGNVHESTSIARWTSAEKIRTGRFRMPEDKKLTGSRKAAATAPRGAVLTPVNMDDLPF